MKLCGNSPTPLIRKAGNPLDLSVSAKPQKQKRPVLIHRSWMRDRALLFATLKPLFKVESAVNFTQKATMIKFLNEWFWLISLV